ncbi:MAG: transcriptional regulator [Magnetococcales bacterium]|nr:transcriptional regulator [Magnetococcales bacterium]
MVGTLKIGIASYEEQKAMVRAIAWGEYVPNDADPKVWFSSLESLSQVLNTKNQLLLHMIATSHPSSIQELADLSKRKVSNLSRTLKLFERYGLVKMEQMKGRKKAPRVTFSNLMFDGVFKTASNQWA